jgi:acetylornithine deacetylase
MADWTRSLREWIEIDSVTGGEADYGEALALRLEAEGFDVERQEAAPGRFNLLARAGRPQVVFCTHLDTVPPWFGSREDSEAVHGRGSCDAKGPALAMVHAARELLAEGETRLGLLFTVGEEVDSVGAAWADEHLAEPWSPRFTIIGEPTENRFVPGHKGVWKAEVVARGVAGHSSQPIGPSAVHELVGCVQRLLGQDWGRHPTIGEGTLNIGEIQGGVAANVVADHARASLLVRAVEPPEVTERKVRACLGQGGAVELVPPTKAYGPTEFLVPEDAETSGPVAFGTDAPHLSRWGRPLLYGPGRILDAHTDHERLSKASFERAVVDYRDTARRLLERLDAGTED